MAPTDVPSRGSRPRNRLRSALLTPPESPPASRWARSLDDATHPSGLTLSWGLESGPAASGGTQIPVSTACASAHVPCHHAGSSVPSPGSSPRLPLPTPSPTTPRLVHSQSALRSLDFHLYSHRLGPGPLPIIPKMLTDTACPTPPFQSTLKDRPHARICGNGG